MTLKTIKLERIYLGAAMGVLAAGMTSAVSTIEGMSTPFLAWVKPLAMVLIIPGLLSSAAIAGNVHAFSLGFAVLINGVLYFTLGWLLYPLLITLKKLRRQ